MDNFIWQDYLKTLTEVEKYQKLVRRKHKKNKSIYMTGGNKNTPPYTKKPSGSRSSAPAGYGALEEVEPQEVPVAGFELHDNLEPNIWIDDKLEPEIRNQLMQIAEDFIENLDMGVEIVDVRLTGSLANYNWSKYSDVDLHVVVRFADVDENYDLVKGFFDSVRIDWNHAHEIMMKGYEVEIYVENVDEKHISTGVYSLMEDNWVVSPTVPANKPEIDTQNIQKKSASIMNQIEKAEDYLEEDPERALRMAERLKEKIRRMRQAGLESEAGQYSIENVSFKVLRRTDYLKRLSDLKTKSYDNRMSVSD